MPNLTQNLGLKKPLLNETADIDVLNENFDTIDSAISGKANVNHTHTKIQISDFSHTHTISDVTNLQTQLDGKASTSHTHTKADITDFAHTHNINEITNLFNTFYAGTTTNSSNNYSVTVSGITSYQEGLCIAVKINADSTGAATININGLGAKSIKKANGNDVSAGNLKANSIYTLRYNGTNFILQGEGGEYGTATADKVLAGYTIGTESGLISGTMPNNGAVIITPSANDQAIPAGYHNGSGKVSAIPSSYKKYATGTTTLIPGDGYGVINVSGLGFKPRIIFLVTGWASWLHFESWKAGYITSLTSADGDKALVKTGDGFYTTQRVGSSGTTATYYCWE